LHAGPKEDPTATPGPDERSAAGWSPTLAGLGHVHQRQPRVSPVAGRSGRHLTAMDVRYPSCPVRDMASKVAHREI